MTSIRLAGAQIPVTQDIQYNKKQIFKALDWAKDNQVDHLVTPEGSLSGYGSFDLFGESNDDDTLNFLTAELCEPKA